MTPVIPTVARMISRTFPSLTSATASGNLVAVAGTLNSLPNSAFNVDVYASDAADSTGYGEGKVYLGTAAVITDNYGNGSFSAAFNKSLGSNLIISATATVALGAATGDTSEFAQTITATTTTAPPVTTPPSISISDVSQNEGNSGTTPFNFTLTRSGDLSSGSTVTVSTSDGTANAGIDYTALNGQTVTFAANQVTATVTVNVNGDTSVESNETFNVIVSAVSNATIGDGSGLGTIVNDDVAPTPPGTPTATGQTVAVTENTANAITLTGSDPDSPPLPLNVHRHPPTRRTARSRAPRQT